MKQFGDVIFAYSLGNEIRSDIVRWHGPRAVGRFLAELYDVGKQSDPGGLFTYSNYPSAEYLDLNFLDIVSFNVYLHRETDYRRYLTHLMAATRDRPLLLSETGMDTIREGEQAQAELLSWQSRAAFELGLSGFIVFAFTDEWHTGGAEITEWAFGLASRERAPKPAFSTVARVFRCEPPPRLRVAPKASVVVPAYNAAATLGECLSSLARLNYPDYEILVVDDGSIDSTPKIAERAGVRLVGGAHRGLSAARNAGVAAAAGQIVAFIDTDAIADRDWLYHLTETITHADAPVVGGQNFAPAARSVITAAIAAAPGEPREVRLGADQLAQVCGCSMALDKSKFATAEVFDVAFDRAGDDVDLSLRLRESGAQLAYAPGAVVIHERRQTIASYLRQQRGYGRAEGLLFRRYPNQNWAGDGAYGGGNWIATWFGMSPRVYYGALGRALFQTAYPGAILPLAAQVPLTIQWFACAVALTVAGVFDRFFGALGIAGMAISILCACAGATLAPRLSVDGIAVRLTLATLWLAGPLIRSWERERVKWSLAPDKVDAPAMSSAWLRGRFRLTPADGEIPRAVEPEAMEGAMRTVFVRRGVIVMKGDGYAPYDLRIIVMPWIRIPILLLEERSQISVAWRMTLAPERIIASLVPILILLLLAGYSLVNSTVVVVIFAALAGLLAFARARRMPRVIGAATAEVAERFGMRVETDKND
jgi:glycosyltransferase involved in cell wall biosynthesis